METNLLELAKSYLSSDVVDQICTMLGENHQDTQTALDGALPVILGALIHKSTEPGGQAIIMDMVAEVTVPNRAAGELIKPEDGAISQLSSLFNGSSDQKSRFLSMGSGIITSLFGNRSDATSSALSAESGIKQTSALSVMSLAGTVLLGVLGRQLFAGEKGQAELGSFLGSQTNYVKEALPSGLQSFSGELPGITKPGNLGSKLADMELGTTASRVATVATPPDADRPVAGIPAFDSSHTSGSGTRWLPWLLLALGVVALIYFLRGCNNDRSDNRSTTSNVGPVTITHFLV